jgi:hypothetical protein
MLMLMRLDSQQPSRSDHSCEWIPKTCSGSGPKGKHSTHQTVTKYLTNGDVLPHCGCAPPLPMCSPTAHCY